MTVDVIYEVKRNDGSDDEMFLMETELTEEEEQIVLQAGKLRKSLNSIESLNEARMREYGFVERTLTYDALEQGNKYVMECIGNNPVDPDELNDLVHSRNKEAIEFFGFEDMSDEELLQWDAHKMKLLPPEYFFRPEAEGPFDLKWELISRFPEVSENKELSKISEKEMTETLRTLFAKENCAEEVRDFADNVKASCNYEFNVEELVKKTAKEFDFDLI